MAGNRGRWFKPELAEHPAFASLSDGAVRTYVGLLPCMDDEGRSLGSAGYLAGRVYFLRRKSKAMIGREVAELERAGLVIRYEAAGVEYIAIRGWNDESKPTYQYIKAKRPSTFPAPPSDSWPTPDATPDATPFPTPGTTAVDVDVPSDDRARQGRARRRSRSRCAEASCSRVACLGGVTAQR